MAQYPDLNGATNPGSGHSEELGLDIGPNYDDTTAPLEDMSNSDADDVSSKTGLNTFSLVPKKKLV